jgi:hypothetical protein
MRTDRLLEISDPTAIEMMGYAVSVWGATTTASLIPGIGENPRALVEVKVKNGKRP